jgi:ankyrin repeat protein
MHSLVLFRVLALSAVIGATVVATTPVAVAPLSIDTLRSDAGQFGMWDARFKACSGFFHEGEGLLWQDYGTSFNERVRQAIATQTDNPRFVVDDYVKQIHQIVDQARAQMLGKVDATPSACLAMTGAFVTYYQGFRDRVMASQDAAEMAQQRTQAEQDQAFAALALALGKDPDDSYIRHPSDLAAARKLIEENAVLRAELPDSGDVFCDAAGYTDLKGLAFLLTEVWPKPGRTCAMKEAVGSAISSRRFDNADWLAGRLDMEDVPALGDALLRAAVKNTSVNVDSDTVDYDALALPVLQKLLAHGLKADATSDHWSLLELAIEGKEPKMAATLIAHGANANGKSYDGRTLLLIKALDSLPIVKALLATPGVQVDAADASGETALEVAIGSDDADVVAALLQAGAKPPQATSYGVPLLASAGSAKILKLLLDRGGDPRWRDKDGNTLLAYASVHHFSELMPVLVDAGLPLNATNRYGATILNYADDSYLGFSADDRVVLEKLGAKRGTKDHRLAIIYGPGDRARGVPYRIRLEDGKVMTGTTDVFGKTSWVQDGQKYEMESTKPAL